MAEWWENFPEATPVDVALQAEGVSGRLADLARSVYAQESSSGKDTRTSNAGAVGGMQIIPATFKRMADEGWNIEDPLDNARAGVRYLKVLDEKAGGDPRLTAVGYYGGEGAIIKARNGISVSDPRNPRAPDTLQYAQQVVDRMAKPAAEGNWWDAYPEVEAAKPGAASNAKPAAQPKTERSMLSELGRQAGLAGRMGVQALATLPAMASDAVTGPINAGLDAVAGKGNGFRFQRAQDALGNVMTAAGVPEPQNATERVVQDIGTAVGGAGGFVKGGQLLAKSAGPVASAVGKQFAAGPGLQITSAATGAGASGSVREEGGGAGAQIAAGLAGALAPGAMPALASGAARGMLRGGEAGRQRVAENLANFEAAGMTPSLGQATEGRVARAAESLLSRTPGGAGIMQRYAEKQADDMARAVQSLSDELAPGASAVNAGEAISRGVGAFKAGFKAVQQRLYNTLDKHLASDTPIPVGNTEFALKELNAGIEGAPNLSEFFKNAKIKGIDKALQADLEQSITGGALPYEAVKKLRTLIGGEIADNSLLSDVPRSKWAALYGALSEDLGIAAKQAGPQAEQSWQWANQFTKSQLARLEQLSGIVSKDSPEKIFQAAITGTAEGDTIIRRVINALPKQERREVAAAVLQRLGRATVGQQNAEGNAFSSQTFLTNLSKISQPARHTLFGRTDADGILERVQKLASVADNIRAGSKVFANPSGTAQALTMRDTALGAGVAALTGNPTIATGAIAVPALSNVTARVMTSKTLPKFAAGQTPLRIGTGAAAVEAASRIGSGGEAQPQRPRPLRVEDMPTTPQVPVMRAPAYRDNSVQTEGAANPRSGEADTVLRGDPHVLVQLLTQAGVPEEAITVVDGGVQIADEYAQELEGSAAPGRPPLESFLR